MKATRKRTPTETLFWAKVQKTDTCWLWTASHIRGYGKFGGGPGRQAWLAH